jgi:hypothetical protein
MAEVRRKGEKLGRDREEVRSEEREEVGGEGEEVICELWVGMSNGVEDECRV